jgi:hypothetical protein
MPPISSIEYLVNAQHSSGGWGYQTGHKAVVEPTAAVLLAIRDQANIQASFQRGLAWLLSCQHPDGGWGINESDPESGWQTAWALIFLQNSGQVNDVIRRAVDWLISVPTYLVSPQELKKSEVPQSTENEALVWPWWPGQAGWVEPTALAVLALNNYVDIPLAAARIKAALAYFERYRTSMGGWNVGNAGPLDTNVPARAYPTSLVLMALACVAQQDIQSNDFTALQQDLTTDPGILAQASGLAAMQILGRHDDNLASNLSKNQLPDGSWEHNPFATAWAMIGLRGYL